MCQEKDTDQEMIPNKWNVEKNENVGFSLAERPPEIKRTIGVFSNVQNLLVINVFFLFHLKRNWKQMYVVCSKMTLGKGHLRWGANHPRSSPPCGTLVVDRNWRPSKTPGRGWDLVRLIPSFSCYLVWGEHSKQLGDGAQKFRVHAELSCRSSCFPPTFTEVELWMNWMNAVGVSSFTVACWAKTTWTRTVPPLCSPDVLHARSSGLPENIDLLLWDHELSASSLLLWRWF